MRCSFPLFKPHHWALLQIQTTCITQPTPLPTPKPPVSERSTHHRTLLKQLSSPHTMQELFDRLLNIRR